MAARLVLMAVLLSLLSGCGAIRDSRFNPANWGGNEVPESLIPADTVVFVDDRPLVDQVTALVLEPAPGGVIVRATGLPQTQGFWAGDLVLEPREDVTDGELVLQFKVLPPLEPQPTATAQTREIVVAEFLSDQALREFRRITVVAARNQRSVSR